jgi:hypothetical protein
MEESWEHLRFAVRDLDALEPPLTEPARAAISGEG